MNIYNNRPIQSINQIIDKSKTTAKKQVQNDSPDFSAILSNKLNEAREIKMSKHAELRMEARNIKLDENQVERLKSAVDKASTKGVRDTLVVMDDIAFVVNVNARTVITAVNQNELKENVFTKIDGAVFT
ncbi:MAG: TIGR02530 family flagellar biosynthesis protein [Acetivibrionales bacterium]|jgi:flagellar operon protein|nr:flagellar biosynthesis protein [Clostridiaceae bacterium]